MHMLSLVIGHHTLDTINGDMIHSFHRYTFNDKLLAIVMEISRSFKVTFYNLIIAKELFGEFISDFNNFFF